MTDFKASLRMTLKIYKLFLGQTVRRPISQATSTTSSAVSYRKFNNGTNNGAAAVGANEYFRDDSTA